MARTTDQNKIERLKQSTMELVVEHGFGGASASLIAKTAGVASGYFYLHYKGKYEMVNTLLHDVYQEVVTKFEELAGNGSSFLEIVENMILHFFEMANAEPIKLKFLYVLTNDYSFTIDREMHNNIYKILNVMVYDGHSSEQLDKQITQTDLYLIVVVNTIQYINQQYKNAGREDILSQKDQDHLIYLTEKILRQPRK